MKKRVRRERRNKAEAKKSSQQKEIEGHLKITEEDALWEHLKQTS